MNVADEDAVKSACTETETAISVKAYTTLNSALVTYFMKCSPQSFDCAQFSHFNLTISSGFQV